MALGDRPGAERGLEKAKAFCKGDFNAIICELQVSYLFQYFLTPTLTSGPCEDQRS